MFGDLSTERIEDPSILGMVMAQCYGALHEREQAVGRHELDQIPIPGNPAYTGALVGNSPAVQFFPEATDFDRLHIEDMAHNLNNLMLAIERCIGFGYWGPARPPLENTDEYTAMAIFCKEDWTEWESIDELLFDAGYPDGWESDRSIENSVLWYQIRDALLLMRWFKIRVSFQTPRAAALATRYTHMPSAWGPAGFLFLNSADSSWGEALFNFNTTGVHDSIPSRLGYRIRCETTGLMKGWRSYIAQEGPVRVRNVARFRGKVAEPWILRWGVKTDLLDLPDDTIVFANDIGDEIEANSSHALAAVEFTHEAEIPLGAQHDVQFSVTTPGAPPTNKPLDNSQFPHPNLVPDGTEYVAQAWMPYEFDHTILWKCDAYDTFDYTETTP